MYRAAGSGAFFFRLLLPPLLLFRLFTHPFVCGRTSGAALHTDLFRYLRNPGFTSAG
jgi:hypothetical protein